MPFLQRVLIVVSVIAMHALVGCTSAAPAPTTAPAPPAAPPTKPAASPAASPSPSPVASPSPAAAAAVVSPPPSPGLVASPSPSPSPIASPSPAAAAAQQPAGATLTISSPAPGQTLPAGSVDVMVQYTGPALVAAANATKLDDLHLHYFLDESATPYLGTLVPVPMGNPNIVHTAALQQTFDQVAAGSHTVTVMLSGSNHISVQPPLSAQVTFTVQ